MAMAKTFFKDGKWTDARIAVIKLCKCGNKYIKTRENQKECLECIGQHKRR